MFIPDCASAVSTILEETFFSGWKTDATVYGKKAMAGQGISLWGFCGQLAHSDSPLPVTVSMCELVDVYT